jgi:tagaturonate reductase
VFSLAALLAFDTIDSDDGEQYYGRRDNGESYPIRDDRRVIESVQAKSLDDVRAILANEALWGEDLNKLPGMAELVWEDLCCIREQGGAKAIECLLAK